MKSALRWAVLSLGASCAASPPPKPVVAVMAEPAPDAPAAPLDRAAPAPRAVAPIAWESSEAAAQARAKRASLPEIVWCRADWAVASLEMERKTWTDPRVAEAARPFVALRLDLTESEQDADLYARRYGLRGLPTIVLIDARGKTSASLYGFVEPEALVSALHAAAEE